MEPDRLDLRVLAPTSSPVEQDVPDGVVAEEAGNDRNSKSGGRASSGKHTPNDGRGAARDDPAEDACKATSFCEVLEGLDRSGCLREVGRRDVAAETAVEIAERLHVAGPASCNFSFVLGYNRNETDRTSKQRMSISRPPRCSGREGLNGACRVALLLTDVGKLDPVLVGASGAWRGPRAMRRAPARRARRAGGDFGAARLRGCYARPDRPAGSGSRRQTR